MSLPRKKTSAAVTALLITAAAVSLAPTAAADPGPTPEPGKLLSVPEGQQVKGRYIVQLLDNATTVSTASANELAQTYGGTAHRVYNHALRGFSAQLSEDEARELSADPKVKYVAPVQIGHSAATQTDPPWGLDRIDQKSLPLDRRYTYAGTAGNVTAYIVDSGIRMSHQDFGGRAKSGYDFVDNDTDASDCLQHGHGTHVAGTVGGSQYGVAKGVKLVSVRILDCNDSSTTEQALNGIDWVTQNAVKPAVANFSLYFGSSDTVIEGAIKRSIASGVVWTLSGNNQNTDACQSSPAKLPEAITVGNTDSSDRRYSNSNYGPCLDIWAPGTSIVSASHQSDTGTRTMTGTSMAAPHVAGAAALYLAANPSATPKETRDALVAQASTVTIGDAKAGSPNKLLNTNPGTTTPPAGPKFENTTDYPIRDNVTTESPITVTNVNGNAPSTLTVGVDIRHTFRGDLRVQLVAPDGTAYLLKDYNSNDGADNVQATYTVNASSEPANGTWKLRVTDNWANDTGYVNSWSLQF